MRTLFQITLKKNDFKKYFEKTHPYKHFRKFRTWIILKQSVIYSGSSVALCGGFHTAHVACSSIYHLRPSIASSGLRPGGRRRTRHWVRVDFGQAISVWSISDGRNIQLENGGFINLISFMRGRTCAWSFAGVVWKPNHHHLAGFQSFAWSSSAPSICIFWKL